MNLSTRANPPGRTAKAVAEQIIESAAVKIGEGPTEQEALRDATERVRLWTLRYQCDLRQKDIAAMVGVKPITFYRWENGVSTPTPKHRDAWVHAVTSAHKRYMASPRMSLRQA